MAVYDDGLDEHDPTPPEYDLFKEWFYQVHPNGDQMVYQDQYRAFQAGYRVRTAVSAGLTGMLREAHAHFAARAPTEPTSDVDPAHMANRDGWLRDEVDELAEAVESGDLGHIAKEGADVIYVAAGTLTEHGIDVDAAVAAVHESNLTKDAAGGGKAAKGPGYREPDMGAVIWSAGRPGDFEAG
jgi:NTP pyrophosphatase (non-canonical NTP hydrolase)